MKRYQIWGNLEDKNGNQLPMKSGVTKGTTYAVAANRAVKILFGATQQRQVNLYIREIK